ncbi:MAG: 30S ribosomal protein S7 [Spirochaetales bacterium]|nr:30S ribosomal protein S7 [Spirochaetales bacterium]
MPRRRITPKRPVEPDSKYGSITVSRFVARMMLQGKKSCGYQIFYDALDVIKAKLKQDPVEVFEKALEQVKPLIEVKSRRVGGSTYQVPMEIKDDRREALAMRWLISFARKRNGKSMSEKLSAELIDAFNSTGASFKKKEDTHRMAEANKAFAHYRW